MESINRNYGYIVNRVEFYTMDIYLSHKQIDGLLYARKQHAIAYQMTNNVELKENIIEIIRGINTTINMLMGTQVEL